MKIILLPLEGYLNIDKRRIYSAFIKDLKINPLNLFYQWLELPWYFGDALNLIRGQSLPALFKNFEKGLITDTQFRTELRNKFSCLATKNDTEIDDAWNKMYIVNKKTCLAFEEANRLHNGQNHFITFYGDLNILHYRTIKQQHEQLTGKINLTPGKLFLFYLEHVEGLDLILKYTQTSVPVPLSEQEPFKKKGKPHILISESPRSFPAKILVVYTPPPAMPYPKLGLLSWLFAPLQSWQVYKKQEYYNNLVNLSTQNNFTIIPSRETADAPNIIMSLQNVIDIHKKTIPTIEVNLNNLPPSTSYTPRYLSPANTDVLSTPRSPTSLNYTSKFKKFTISS